MTLTSLSRVITGGRRFIAEVDGLRFVEIMAVVLFHLCGYTLAKHMTGAEVGPLEGWLPSLMGIGHFGVQLFFILSGFLLAMPFAKWRLGLSTRPSLKKYYFRRLTRLEPPYITALLLLFVGGLIAFGMQEGLARWPHLIANLFYQHNLIYQSHSPISTVVWTLEIEVQFYIAAPLFASVFSIRNILVRRIGLAAVMVAAPFARGLASNPLATIFSLSLPGFIEFFAAGFILADLYLVDWTESPRRSLGWDAVSAVGWSATLALMLSGTQPWLIAPSALLAYVGSFRGEFSNRVFTHPLLTTIGGMCYSMYLLHYSVISVMGRLAQRILLGASFSSRFAVELLICLPSILVATALYFVFLERPCMDPDWPSRFFDRARRLAPWAKATLVPRP